MEVVAMRRGPNSAIVVGALALAVGTAGSATAAALITSKQIKDGTIQLRDISRTTQTTLKGRAGPIGPAGARGSAGAPGPAGPTGAQGFPGSTTLAHVFGAGVANPPGTQVLATASCPPETPNIVGGGVLATGEFAAAQSVNSSGPMYADADSPTDGWFAFVDNRGAATEAIGVSAICTKAATVNNVSAARALKR